MKALILVDSVASLPQDKDKTVLIVTQLNWEEVYHYLYGKTIPVYIYLHENCPFERLLKLVEDYKGDMAVYTQELVSPIFLSRFTRVVNRKSFDIDKEFGSKSELATLVADIKSCFK